MRMYDAADGTVYGYASSSSDEFKYKMFENKEHGRYCKSGMAVLDASANTATCVKISNVKTNYDAFATDQASPYKCKLPTPKQIRDGTYKDACKYYYKDNSGTEKVINTGYCECSMMPTRAAGKPQVKESPIDPLTVIEGEGFCPFPSQEELDKYIENKKPIIDAMPGVLQTDDRDNLEAMKELLVGDKEVITNATWSDLVT